MASRRTLLPWNTNSAAAKGNATKYSTRQVQGETSIQQTTEEDLTQQTCFKGFATGMVERSGQEAGSEETATAKSHS